MIFEGHVERRGVDHIFRITIADDTAVGPRTEARYRHVTTTLVFGNVVPDVLHRLERIGTERVIAVDGDNQLTGRFAHATIEGGFLVLVFLPDIMNGEVGFTLPFQHNGPRTVG